MRKKERKNEEIGYQASCFRAQQILCSVSFFSLYSLCVCPTVCLSICLSDYLSMPLSLLLWVRLSVPLSLHLSVRLSACPSACLCVCPSVCQSASQLDKLCQLPSPTPHLTCFRHFALIKFITNVIHTHARTLTPLCVCLCVDQTFHYVVGKKQSTICMQHLVRLPKRGV